MRRFGYQGPQTVKPMRESAESNFLQAETTAAATAEVFKILKELFKENPNVLLKSLQNHHVERIAVAAVSGYELKRAEQERVAPLRAELNDELPEGWQ